MWGSEDDAGRTWRRGRVILVTSGNLISHEVSQLTPSFWFSSLVFSLPPCLSCLSLRRVHLAFVLWDRLKGSAVWELHRSSSWIWWKWMEEEKEIQELRITGSLQMSLKICSLVILSCSHLVPTSSPSTCPEHSCSWGWGRQVSRCQGGSRLLGWLDRKCRGLSSLHWTTVWSPALEGAGGRNGEDSENIPIQKSIGPWEDQYQPNLSEPVLFNNQGTEKDLNRWTGTSLLLILGGQTETKNQRSLFLLPRIEKWRDQLELGVSKAMVEERGLQPSPATPIPFALLVISFFLFVHCISGCRPTHPERSREESWEEYFECSILCSWSHLI